MAIYLAELLDEKRNGTGKQKKITVSGPDGLFVQARTEYMDHVRILEVLNAGPNYNT